MRLIALLALLSAICAQAQVYKWVDEKGNVHYGEQPPPEAKTTKLNVPAPGDVAPTAKAGSPERKDAAQPAGDASRCAHEKLQLKVLDGDAEVTYTNSKGEAALLDGAKREAMKEDVRQLIKKYCS